MKKTQISPWLGSVIFFVIVVCSGLFVWANLSSLYAENNDDKLNIDMWNELVNRVITLQNKIG